METVKVKFIADQRTANPQFKVIFSDQNSLTAQIKYF
jgi:hypothetical protein